MLSLFLCFVRLSKIHRPSHSIYTVTFDLILLLFPAKLIVDGIRVEDSYSFPI